MSQLVALAHGVDNELHVEVFLAVGGFAPDGAVDEVGGVVAAGLELQIDGCVVAV